MTYPLHHPQLHALCYGATCVGVGMGMRQRMREAHVVVDA